MLRSPLMTLLQWGTDPFLMLMTNMALFTSISPGTSSLTSSPLLSLKWWRIFTKAAFSSSNREWAFWAPSDFSGSIRWDFLLNAFFTSFRLKVLSDGNPINSNSFLSSPITAESKSILDHSLELTISINWQLTLHFTPSSMKTEGGRQFVTAPSRVWLKSFGERAEWSRKKLTDSGKINRNITKSIDTTLTQLRPAHYISILAPETGAFI